MLCQGCVLLSVMIKECKGKTDAKVFDCQASQACKGKTDAKVFDCQASQACKGKTDPNVFDSQASQAGNSGDYLGPSKPCTLVRSEVVQLYSVHNENVDVLEESGPI